MKALVKYAHGPGNMEIKEVARPQIGPDEVLVKVKACGLDRGGDLRIYHYSSGHKYNVPLIPGNEVCGEVAELGKNVKGWSQGERVVSEVVIHSCGECFWCINGDFPQCPKKLLLGRSVNGAFAEYFKVRPRYLHRIPENISWDEAVLTENAAVVINNIVERTGISAGDRVVIIGPGPIGQMSAQIAKASGASKVIVTGVKGDEWRLNLARKLGADLTVNIREQDPLEVIQSLTNGRGADIVIEASGYPDAVEEAFNLVRPSGKIAQIGHYFGKVNVTWTKVLDKNLKIIGSYAHKRTAWERALSMISAKQINVRPLLTHKLPLEKWKEAFEMADKVKDLCKICFLFE